MRACAISIKASCKACLSSSRSEQLNNANAYIFSISSTAQMTHSNGKEHYPFEQDLSHLSVDGNFPLRMNAARLTGK